MEGAPKKKTEVGELQKKGHPRQKQMNRRDFLVALGATASLITAEGIAVANKKKSEAASTEKLLPQKEESEIAQKNQTEGEHPTN